MLGEGAEVGMKNARLIYNPQAGALQRQGPAMLQRALDELRGLGVHAELAATTGPRTGGAIARDLVEREGVDTILVAGGDGTINEVMNGVVHTDVSLGVLPAGTANVLANEMRIGTWKRALAALPQLRTVRVPVGKIESEAIGERYFLMMAGAGFDARMVQAVSPELKRSLGKFAYWLTGFSQIGRNLEQLVATVNGERYQASFCLASRVRNYGGDLAIAPTIHITENDLEVILFEGRFTTTYLIHLFSIVSGRMEMDSRIKVLRARRIDLAPAGSDPVHVQVDGEHVGVLPTRVSVEPGALNLLVPPEYLGESRRTAA